MKGNVHEYLLCVRLCLEESKHSIAPLIPQKVFINIIFLLQRRGTKVEVQKDYTTC